MDTCLVIVSAFQNILIRRKQSLSLQSTSQLCWNKYLRNRKACIFPAANYAQKIGVSWECDTNVNALNSIRSENQVSHFPSNHWGVFDDGEKLVRTLWRRLVWSFSALSFFGVRERRKAELFACESHELFIFVNLSASFCSVFVHEHFVWAPRDKKHYNCSYSLFIYPSIQPYINSKPNLFAFPTRSRFLKDVSNTRRPLDLPILFEEVASQLAVCI